MLTRPRIASARRHPHQYATWRFVTSTPVTYVVCFPPFCLVITMSDIYQIRVIEAERKSFHPLHALNYRDKLATRAAITIEPPSMALLRVALLCQLSVAGAVRLATNVPCLPIVQEEVRLDLSGARATAFPKGIPQADALGCLWRRLDLPAQQLGRGGWEGQGKSVAAEHYPLPIVRG